MTHFARSVIPRIAPHEVCDLIDSGGGDPPASLWTLDPIDGTKGFLRHEQYAVALAFIRDGRVELGVLGCPELEDGRRPELNGAGSIVAATSGLGAWTRPIDGDGDWKKLTVSEQSKPTNARLLRSVEKAHTNTDEIGQLAGPLGCQHPGQSLWIAKPSMRSSRQAWAISWCGYSPRRSPTTAKRFGIRRPGRSSSPRPAAKSPTSTATSLDFSCGRTLAENRGILATNGHLHKAVLAALKAIGA